MLISFSSSIIFNFLKKKNSHRGSADGRDAGQTIADASSPPEDQGKKGGLGTFFDLLSHDSFPFQVFTTDVFDFTTMFL